jgi:HK97 family phage major capsid protein
VDLFELKRDLEAKKAQGRAILEPAIAEKRDLTPDEKTRLTAVETEMGNVSRSIALFEAHSRFQAASPADQRSGAGLGPELPELDGKHKYSVVRALRMSLEVREGRGKFDGIEAEVHDTLLKSRAEGAETKGVLIPWQLATSTRDVQSGEQRDVTVTTAAGGIANILGTPMIELLRNRMVFPMMGGTVLSGLTGGTFSLPKQTGAETAYHVAEGIAPSSSNLTLGLVTWTPRTVAARSVITRKTLLQSSIDIEMLVRNSIVLSIGREFDRVGVNGSGTSNIPLGILQDSGVVTVPIGTNGGAPTWALVCALESSVATGNADFGKLGYLTSNKGRSKLKQTTKIASSQYSDFLWQKGEGGPGMGEVNSYQAMATEQVPSNLTKGTLSGTGTALVFGNFESATYGLWSGIDVLIDPYTSGSSGGINMYAYQDYDFQFRYQASFAKCVDIDPS